MQSSSTSNQSPNPQSSNPVWSAWNAADFTPFGLWMLTILFAALGAGSALQTQAITIFLVVGLVTIGIPHGAVDHLLDSGMWNAKQTPAFILGYLAKAAAMALLWIYFPTPAFVFFIVYSAFHFGEADGKQWGFSRIESVLWGCSVITYMLCTHSEETTAIIQTMDIGMRCPAIPFYSLLPWLAWSAVRRSTTLAITVMWIMAASMLPLLAEFGMYFIGQHSFTSWVHICKQLGRSQRSVWLHALPFNIGAWLLLGFFVWMWPHSEYSATAYSGTFFIFVACISFPHVVEMHWMYKNFRL